MRLGLLPDRYRAVARKGWQGVKSRIDIGADGAVNIRGTVVGLSVGGNVPQGFGAVLLAASELEFGDHDKH